MNEVQTHFVGGDSISVALRGAHICMATVFHILNSDYEVLRVALESLRPGGTIAEFGTRPVGTRSTARLLVI